jgi:hypothetical protein
MDFYTEEMTRHLFIPLPDIQRAENNRKNLHFNYLKCSHYAKAEISFLLLKLF